MATIREIAQLANVSIGTVDRVIHKRGRVAKKTEDKIRQIIKETNFRPNVFARTLKLSKTFHFGVLIPFPGQDSKYWEIPLRGIRKAEEELSSHKLRITFFYYDKYSEMSISSIKDDILGEKLDGLLVAPVLSGVFAKLVEELPQELPYVFFDAYIPDTRCIAYVGQDSFQSGVLAGKLMDLLVREPGTVAIIKFVPEDNVIEERADGFQDYIDKNTSILTRNYFMDETLGDNYFKTIAERIIAENSDLQGIFVTYAATFKFAKYMKENISKRKIGVIGYDPVDENIQALKNGEIDFMISQMPERQGYDGIYTLYRHIVLKEKIPHRVWMPMNILTKENVGYYLTAPLSITP